MIRLTACACVALVASAASAQGWEHHRSEKYGFEMLVPSGTTIQAEKLGQGWAGLLAKSGDVTVYGLARLGKPTKADAIRTLGAKHTGVPLEQWEKVTAQRGKNGWKWFEAHAATKGKKILFVGYGEGKKGAYLLVLQTTKKDYAANKDQYAIWYRNLRVF